ncbi:hypothetical protein SISNIDRAFT_460857 [Sistotremastrum niveocremeum HHB9708]|uniref:Uncharacterized protein n=1 Tax=Sistotremastrum niveocremeum HHB9708 TaxID=1314777 RepID=A0A164N8M1_9AGAM|nr:hypothetical protein SISNIDRAFT_460857 [Sistotremastrum niveocremeum HHB9708]
MAHEPSVAPSDDNPTVLANLRAITFAHLTVEDVSRVLASISLPQLSSMAFNNVAILHRPIPPENPSTCTLDHHDLQRVIDQGSYLQLSWSLKASVYQFTALLFDQSLPKWSEGNPESLKATFTFLERDNSMNTPPPDPRLSRYLHPIVDFFDALAQFWFEGVQVLNVLPAAKILFPESLGPVKKLLDICGSLTTLHLHNLDGTNFWEGLAEAEEWGNFPCPNLTVMTVNSCEGRGLSLEQLLVIRKGMGHALRYCELRSFDVYPADFDLTPLAEYVVELKMF